jgi:PleD family two-component response regulator
MLDDNEQNGESEEQSAEIDPQLAELERQLDEIERQSDEDEGQEDESEDEQQGGEGRQKKTIMVVDDSTVGLLAVTHVLGKAFDVRMCNNSKSAFLMLESAMPDLILLDIEMPGMNGFEFMKEFKRKYPDSNIPVIFVTSHKARSAVVMAAKAGARGYVSKPFSKEVLMSKVIDALKG